MEQPWTQAERAQMIEAWRSFRGLPWWLRVYERLRIARVLRRARRTETPWR